MKKENFKNYSYLFFLFGFLFLGFFLKFVLGGTLSDYPFAGLLFLGISLLQFRVGWLFRRKAGRPDLR